MPKLYHCVTNSHRTQVTPNQLFMVIVRPMCLGSYISTRCKGHGQLQDHVFPGGLNVEGLYCELNYRDQKIRRTPARDIRNSIHNIIPLLKKENVHLFQSNPNNLHTVIGLHVFLSNDKNLHTFIWFQIFLSNTHNLPTVMPFQSFIIIIIIYAFYLFTFSYSFDQLAGSVELNDSICA